MSDLTRRVAASRKAAATRKQMKAARKALQLEPKLGFQWSKVTWGRPDSPVSALCSYCSAVIPEDAIPLRVWKGDGHAAQFCDSCQRLYWGLG